MRRILLPALLIASHGIAIWLGSQRPWRNGAGVPQGEATPPARAGVAELQRRAEERRAADENKPPFRAGVKAHRLKIAHTADVAAMVKAGAGEPIDYREGDVPDEVLAAYGIWLDRDPLAALRWLAEWDRERDTWSFSFEIVEHLRRVGGSKLGEYLKAVPEARKHVVTMALPDLLDESSPAVRTDIILGMPRPEDRIEWLTGGQSSAAERFQGQLARIREALGFHGADVFLRRLSEDLLGEAQLAEIRSAGFPAGALADCERRQERLKLLKEAPEPVEESPKIPAVPLEASPIQAANIISENVPEFKDWCEDAAEGRLTPDDIMRRLSPHLVSGDGSGEWVRNVVLIQIFHSNPRLALQWIQASGGDVRAKVVEALQHSGGSVPGEVRAEIAAQVFTDEVPGKVAEGLAGFYQDWHRADAGACLAAIRRLPEGPLKRRLQAIGKEEAE